MPRYSVEEDGWGELPPFFPADVRDASGASVEDVVRCDTDSGWCEVLTRDADGACVVVDHEAGEVQRHWEQHPAPLRLVEVR